jgi:hypothetical protein
MQRQSFLQGSRQGRTMFADEVCETCGAPICPRCRLEASGESGGPGEGTCELCGGYVVLRVGASPSPRRGTLRVS